ncbi:MAG: hypothetical protein DRH56_08230, partial [Deltaproteobacteria bacterium]
MGTGKKILWGIIALTLLFFLLLGGLALFVYHHPRTLTSTIEKVVARAAGASLEIRSLSGSLRPLQVRAGGILLRPRDRQRGFYLKVDRAALDLSLEGPFGHRRLVLKNLDIDGCTLRVQEGMILPRIGGGRKNESLFARAAGALAGFFLFRDVRFEAARVANGTVTARSGARELSLTGIRARLEKGRPFRVSCRAGFRWPSQKISVTIPRLLLVTRNAFPFSGPVVGGDLSASGAVFRGDGAAAEKMDLKTAFSYDRARGRVTVGPAVFSLQKAVLKQPAARAGKVALGITLAYDFASRKLTADPLDLCIEDAGIRMDPGWSISPVDLRLSAAVGFDFAQGVLSVPRFRVRLKDVFSVAGGLDGGIADGSGIRVRLSEGRLWPRKAAGLLPPKVKAAAGAADFSGPVRFSGAVRIREDLRLESDLRILFGKNHVTFHRGRIRAAGDLSGQVRVRGTLPRVRLTARLQLDHGALRAGETALGPFGTALSVSGEYPRFRITKLALHLPEVAFPRGGKKLRVRDIRLRSAAGTFDVESGPVSLPDLRLESGLLHHLRVSLETGGGHLRVTCGGDETGLVAAAAALGLVPPGWKLEGTDAFRVEAEDEPGGGWRVRSRLDLRGLSFESGDGLYTGEKISLGVDASGAVGASMDRFSGEAALRADAGEILLDRYYVDLKENGLFFSLDGAYAVRDRRLRLSRLEAGFRHILSARLRGSLCHDPASPKFDLFLTVPGTPLAPIFEHFVLEPFQDEIPSLAKLKFKGDVSADFRLTRDGPESDVRGRLLWRGGRVSSDDPAMRVDGIDLDLPLWYRTAAGNGGESPLNGHLTVTSLSIPFLPAQPLDLSLSAGPGTLRVKGPTSLRIPGGTVRIGPVRAGRIFRSDRCVETRIGMEEIDIHPLLARLWPRPIKGRVSGRLDPVRFENGNVVTKGSIGADVFGGRIVISDLGATGLFSPAPLFRLSARWDGLRLAEITTGTSFGKIEGVLRGYIRDLEIAYGQPQKFDLLLETVKTKGVRQKISVKAVDNIARIGGGQSPFMGIAGVFASLFKQFSYKKIGLHATL